MGQTNTISLVDCRCSLQRRRRWRRGEGSAASFKLVSPTRDRTSWTHQPFSPTLSPPPLQSSHGGNAGLWIIGNFNPLKAIIQSRTFQIYSSAESSCLSQTCALVLETSCHAPAHTFSLFFFFFFYLFPPCFDSFNAAQALSDMVSCVCVCAHCR